MKVMSASILALGLIACQKQGAQSPVTKAEAEQIAEHAEQSFTSGNVDAIMKQYANGAVMIDASTAAPSADRKVQAGWAQTFVSMKPADYRVLDRQIQIVGPDAFVSTGTETFTVEAGSARPTVSARFNDVFQRQKDGSWKIVNEHVSMPPAPTAQP